MSLTKAYMSESALRAVGLSESFWYRSVFLIELIKSSGTPTTCGLGSVENLRKAGKCAGRYVLDTARLFLRANRRLSSSMSLQVLGVTR
jgi:hypothetical protein